MSVNEARTAPPAGRVGFAALLSLVMATSTFAITTFSVLSRELITAFALARWELGLLVTGLAAVGAVTSPVLGGMSDRIGGRGALVTTFGLSFAVLAGIAAAPAYFVLIAVALVGGLAQATANPATNKLISLHVAPGTQGAVTGLKQAGVQVGVLLGGVLLPLGAITIGWRATLAMVAVVPIIGALVAVRVLPPDAPVAKLPRGRGVTHNQSPFLRRLATYGLLLGAGWSSVFTYLSDFVQTQILWEATTAGLVVAVAGAFGVAGRVTWSWVADRRLGAPRTLMTLGVISAVGAGCLLAAPVVPALVWVGAAAFGASAGSWNAVGMFAIIERMPSDAAGQGSGVVMFGFLVGLAIGPPPFGWSVDATGSFTVGLSVVVAILVASVAIAGSLRDAVRYPVSSG